MNSKVKTYAVGSGEITLTASDAEELRIMLQREHVHSVMEAVVHDNIDNLKLPGKRCERALADWLTEAFGEYVTIDPETDIHVIETAEDLMFGRAEDLGWYGEDTSRVPKRVASLSSVEFYGTGGGCVMFSALVNNSAWLSTDFDSAIYTDVNISIVDKQFFENGVEYDSHYKIPEGPLPTWKQIFDAICEHCPSDVETAKIIMENFDMYSVCTHQWAYPEEWNKKEE